MRIIRGTHKGRVIKVPKNFKARPTTDFAKENIFNVIENNFYLDEINVLDLFSGSGGISFEFSSRGSCGIDLVEKDMVHYSYIKKTIDNLDLKNISTIKGDAFKYLEKSIKTYDIIFADPPYEMKGIEKIPELVFERKLLKEEGWLILEHSKNTKLSYTQNLIDHRAYGSVNFAIYGQKKD